jgi:hypothetical protein
MFGEENTDGKFQKNSQPQHQERQAKPQVTQSKPAATLGIKAPGFDKPLPKSKPVVVEKIQAPQTPLV